MDRALTYPLTLISTPAGFGKTTFISQWTAGIIKTEHQNRVAWVSLELEHLERANMFTIPLDQEQRWYRYHHLFKDVLRHRLQQAQPDVVFDLHHRAAAWYMAEHISSAKLKTQHKKWLAAFKQTAEYTELYI